MQKYLIKLINKFQPVVVIVGFVVSIFVSLFFLTTILSVLFGIVLLVGIRFWWLNRQHTSTKQTATDIMEGEYRVIENHRVITITKKSLDDEDRT